MSYWIGPGPMGLDFTPMEVIAAALSVGVVGLVSHDGESHWMEGVLLLVLYLILAIGFFFVR